MLLSVIVTIVDGGETLVRCLHALQAQQGSPALEVIVPYDASVPGMPAVIAMFPRWTFVDLGGLDTAASPASATGQHELFDRRRAAGLARARGDLVAILEDRGAPRAIWATTARQLHERLAYGVIGGAIENGCDRTLNWAVYFCDFGRYQLPFAAGARRYVSDVNVTYKRAALEATRPVWERRYHETLVHDALLRAGDTLFLSPDLIVDEWRSNLHLASLARERLAWGRLFAALRTRKASITTRLILAASAPLLPALLFLRLGRLQLQKRASRRQFATAAPAVALLLACWSAGEFLGYLTASEGHAR